MEAISVWHDDDNDHLFCGFGVVDLCRTRVHNRDGSAAPCVHLLGPMPKVMLFSRHWVAQQHWQPIILSGLHPPIIASRRGNLITVAVHRVGTTAGCNDAPPCKLRPRRCWTFRLAPMCWGDDPAVDDKLWLGVCGD